MDFSSGGSRAAAQWTRKVAAAARGELAAFGWLYDQTSSTVYGHLIAQNHSEADTRLQQAYQAYWSALPRLANRDQQTTTIWLLIAAAR